MMASKSMKVLNIIAGVLLIVAGIYCLCNQDIAAMTAGVMVGIFMLLSGVIEIVVFATTSGCSRRCAASVRPTGAGCCWTAC